MRVPLLVGSLATLCLALTFGAARAVRVPGDYPTIQAALDAGAARITVAPGIYHERLQVTRDVELTADDPSAVSDSALAPTVDAMQIAMVADSISRGFELVTVRGFRFTGPVTRVLHSWLSGGMTKFEACWLDSGFSSAGIGIGSRLDIHGCRIRGDVKGRIYFGYITGNTVVGGGIVMSVGAEGLVSGNRVVGPAAVGISAPSDDWGSLLRGNTVRNVQDGISIRRGTADSNLVEDCRGTAYRAVGPAHICGNVARRCGGHGVEIAGGGGGEAVGNVIDGVGLSGIHLAAGGIVRRNRISHSGAHGIWDEAGSGVGANLVLEAGGDGIRSSGTAEGNVVGRSAGAGIVAAGAAHNTSYLNGGPGFEVVVGEGITATVTHNIAYGNTGPGLLGSGGGTLVLGCNDWYANVGGAVSGTAPGAIDLDVDPRFCDLARDSVTLRSDSPLLSVAGCGLLGALGMGCEPPVAMRFSLSPDVLNPRSSGRWVTGCLQPPAGFVAQDIEVRSIRLNDTVPVDTLGPASVADHDADGVRDLEVKFDRAAAALTVAAGAAVKVTVRGKVAGRPFAGATCIRVQGVGRTTGAEAEVRAEDAPPTPVRLAATNPARGRVLVWLTLPDSRPASLALYDVSGRLVASRDVGGLGAGTHQLSFGRPGGLPPGLYLVRLQQGSAVRVRRVIALE